MHRSFSLLVLGFPLLAACAATSGDATQSSHADVTEGDASRLHATSLFASNGGTCAILADGDLRCWGSNSFGEGGYVNQSGGDGASGPIPVATIPGQALRGTGGMSTSCALIEAPTGQLPATLAAPSSAARLPLGASNDVGLYCWGMNLVPLAPGAVAGSSNGAPERVAIDGLSTSDLIGMGSHGDLVVAGAGGVSYLLGNRVTKIDALDGQKITHIGMGFAHHCVASDSDVWCWGYNADGELGNGTTTDSPVPTKVAGLTGKILSLAATTAGTCAATTDGVWCWGIGTYGQLGNGKQIATNTQPVKNPSLSGVTKLVGGLENYCALANGVVSCWGINQGGADVIGEGAGYPQLTPLVVKGLSGKIADLAAGQSHTCALSTDGVQCWGANMSGQLGGSSPSTFTSAAPLFVLGAVKTP